MAPTKQVLRLQSDQILEGPQVGQVGGTGISLKDLTATRAINLVWVEPAAADWDVSFKDPTANDTVVYENLAQPLNNKTLGTPTITDFTNANHTHASTLQGGSVAHSDLTGLGAGDPHTQYPLSAGRGGGQTIIGGSAASENLSLQSTANVTRGDIIAIDDILMGSGKEVLGLPAVPSGATAATSKAYVDLAVSGGASWKETLLTSSQLDNTNNAVANAVPFYLVNTAQIGDALTIDDGSTAETWIFAVASAINQPAIGASALDSMTDLAARINIDSTEWSALLGTALQGINPAGNVVVIYRRTPTASTTDSIYGTFGTPADAQIVDYGTDVDYRDSVSVQLPSLLPPPNFGFGRITSALRPNDTHLVRLEDSAYVWNEDASTWQLSAGAISLATSGAGGNVVGQATFDSAKGLQIVTPGVVEVRVDGSSINFVGGELAVAGGAIAFGTSGSGGGIEGKVSADSDKGLLITGGPTNAILEVKVDATSVAFNLSGELSATGAPLAPTGLISIGQLLTRDIFGITPPTPNFIATDIPVQDYPNTLITGQLFDFVVPEDYDGGTIEILASYQMSTTLAASAVMVETAAKIVKASTGVVDAAAFSASSSPIAVPGVAGVLTRDLIMSMPNPSGVNFQRGDTLQVYVKRLGADGSDTHTGVWQITAFAYRYTGQIFTRLMEPVAEIFEPVSGPPSPPPGFFDTDIPIINFSDTVDQAVGVRFVVPDNWDGISDSHVRLQYALDGAAAGTVRLNTVIRIADVVGGSVVTLPAADFDRAVTADIDPHRTQIIRSVPGAAMTPGSVIQVVITRDTSVGGNAAAGFQVINATMGFGISPVSGLSQITDFYLDDPVSGNIVGTVFADWDYPDFAGDFEQLWKMNSTAPGGHVDVAFAGRLAPTQGLIEQIAFNVKGVDTGTVTYTVKVYCDGNGATPAFTQVASTPPGALTSVAITGAVIVPQPTGAKRFFVVIEADAMANGEEVSISKPFVRVS